MKKFIKVALIVAVVAILVIAGSVAIYLSNVKTPETSVDRIELKSVDPSANTMTFLVTLDMHNSNLIPIRLLSITVNIYLDQQFMGVIDQNPDRELPAGASTVVAVEMLVSQIPKFNSTKISVAVKGESKAKVMGRTYTSGINDAEVVDISNKIPAVNKPPIAVIMDDSGMVVSRFWNITFDGQGSMDPDGTITAYDWDFGDGQTATGATVKHRYSSLGQFIVELTVTDNLTATGKTTRNVNVI